MPTPRLPMAPADPTPAWQKPRLRGAELELTTRCPCRCITCGSSAGTARDDEFELDDWLGLLDELAEQGCKMVTLLGGEPLCFEGWPEIVRRCRARGMKVEIVTSGVTVTERVAQLAKEVGLSSITVSVDGTQAEHDQQRRIAHGYDKAIEAIRRLDAAGLHVGVATQLNRLSVPTLEALAPRLQEAGALAWQVQLTFPMGRANHSGVELRPDEMAGVLDIIRRLRRRPGLGPTLTDGIGYYCQDDVLLRTLPGGRPRPWIQCFAGIRHIGITSHGRVKGCLALPDSLIEGDLHHESLTTIWQDAARFAYTRSFSADQLDGPCAPCPHGQLCKGGCTALAMGFHGKPHISEHCLSLCESPNHAC